MTLRVLPWLFGVSALAVGGLAIAHANYEIPALRNIMYRVYPLPDFRIYRTYQNADLALAGQPREVGALYPDAGEEGERTAIRFEPDAEFDLTDIKFLAANATTNFGHGCDASLARQVSVYVSTELKPPADAVPDGEWTLPGIVSTAGSVMFEVELPTPINVPKGSVVYVVIDMPGTYPNDMGCLTDWLNASPESPDQEYWSNAVDAPFSWQPLQSFGIDAKPFVTIEGIQSL